MDLHTDGIRKEKPLVVNVKLGGKCKGETAIFYRWEHCDLF